jgi:hypothetical protein
MSNITASAKTAVTTENFVEAVLAEDVKFHTVRGNGTTRRIRVLKGDDLEVAEWVMEQREEGRTMKDIAAEMSVSVPTVRRLINRYLLTEEITEADDTETEEWVEVVEVAEDATEEPATEAPATEEAAPEATDSK